MSHIYQPLMLIELIKGNGKASGSNIAKSFLSYDETQIKEDTSLIVIQINGKKRGLITADSNSSQTEIIKLVYEDKKIAKYLVGNKIKKQIYIQNKLINIII